MLLFLYVLLWLANFYLFGMQRATLLISRSLKINYIDVAFFFLPYNYTLKVWFIRILKIIVLILIFYFYSFYTSLYVAACGYLLSIVCPIPYKILYFKKFLNKLEVSMKFYLITNIELYHTAKNIRDFLFSKNIIK